MLNGNSFSQKRFKIYFVGIGGISMSALAMLLKSRGFIVFGCDRAEGETVEMLRKNGVSVNEDGDLEKCDLAVTSSAVPSDDPIVKRLASCGKTIVSRAWLLARFAECFPVTVGVAGTHGKTTCTCILAHIFKAAGLGFTMHVGGLDEVLGNYATLGSEIFLTEVCEYKRNIAFFSPEIGVLLNIDDDHEESYGSFKALSDEFNAYASRSKIAVVNLDDENISPEGCVTLSCKKSSADYYLDGILFDGEYLECAVFGLGERLFEIRSRYLAPHDGMNILAAVAVASTLDIPFKIIKRGIEEFVGVKRRNEFLGEYEGVPVYADYAHHPEQVSTVVGEYERRYGKNVRFLFQSHTYSRTARLKNEFIAALLKARNLYLFKTYGARESYDEAGEVYALAKGLPHAVLCIGDGAVETAFSNLTPRSDVIAQPFLCDNRPIGADFVSGKGSFSSENERRVGAVVVLGAGDLYDQVKAFLKTNADRNLTDKKD